MHSNCCAKEYILMSETVFSDFIFKYHWLQIGYGLVKQILLFSLENRDNPMEYMLYEIAKVVLKHKVHKRYVTIGVIVDT
ncbi:hypothetical protein BJ944DRAFT_270733 [Cunninghamella echinulata]|nr:hypothetical protein BJ944DRAFT_270733 [Cunninghamella echinulata]